MSSAKILKPWKIITNKDIEQNEDGSEQINNSTVRNTINTQFSTNKNRPLIWGDLSTKSYWKKNLLPFLIEAVYLILCFKVPINYIIYVTFFFYLSLFIYFACIKSFSFNSLIVNIKSGFNFWKPVIICSLLFGTAIGITEIIIHFVPEFQQDFFPLKITNILTLVIFSLTSLFLAPVAGEVFYRGNLIYLESKSLLFFTSIASILLFAIAHSFSIWGIISVIIWAIPLTLIFIKTRNFYVTMTAHFIVNVIITLPTIIHYLGKI